MRKITVAVTGLDCRENPYPGLAVARALRKSSDLEFRIIALTYSIYTTGIYQPDMFDAIYIIPYPFEPESKLLQRLLEIHKIESFDLIIPALDSEIAIYSRLTPPLHAAGIRTFLPSEASVKARNKDNLAGTCRRLRIRTPKTITVTHLEQLDQAIPLAYPMVIKGPFADAHIAADKEELKAYYVKILSEWGFPALLQECIVGEEFDIAVVATRDHKVLAHAAMRKFAISDRGKASAAIIIDDAELKTFADEIIARLQWVGPCELELMRETATGRYFLLEINARFPAWIYLTAESGSNLPETALRYALSISDSNDKAQVPGYLFFRNRVGTIVDSEMMYSILAESKWIAGSP